LRGNGLVYALRHARDARADIASIILHAGLWLAVPVALLGPDAGLVNYFVISGLIGVYLGALFIPNHVGMPIVPEGEVQSYLVQQTMTARNFGGSGLVAFLAGGLDSQIEHHLVPHLPNVRLRKARAVVREFCAQRVLPYREAGYLAIWRDVLTHFHRIGSTAADPKRGSG
jgi:fatty acid desaturase